MKVEIDKLNALMILPEKESEAEVNQILEQTRLVEDEVAPPLPLVVAE